MLWSALQGQKWTEALGSGCGVSPVSLRRWLLRRCQQQLVSLFRLGWPDAISRRWSWALPWPPCASPLTSAVTHWPSHVQPRGQTRSPALRAPPFPVSELRLPQASPAPPCPAVWGAPEQCVHYTRCVTWAGDLEGGGEQPRLVPALSLLLEAVCFSGCWRSWFTTFHMYRKWASDTRLFLWFFPLIVYYKILNTGPCCLSTLYIAAHVS